MSILSSDALAGRTAVISGGARGIGAAVCSVFSTAGAHVVIADSLVEEGEALAQSLGDHARFHRVDVTSEDDWRNVIASTMERRGALDALVTCAGIVSFAPLADVALADFERVLQVNLTGTFLGIKHAGLAMRAGAGGSIVTLSSTAGLEGGNTMAAYCASKWAVRGLTKVAAQELACFGIRVNSVHPGAVDTPMLNPKSVPRDELGNLSVVERTPMGRVADPNEIAEVCAFLASDGSSFMTGAELAVDGGATVGMVHRRRPGAPVTI